MLIGFVSDERYVALPDVSLEFVNASGQSWETRSRASGSVHLDLPDGEYLVTLQRAGFGGKRVRVTLPIQHGDELHRLVLTESRDPFPRAFTIARKKG